MKTDGIDYRKEFDRWAKRAEENTPPSERKPASELYDDLFKADYCYWREGGDDHRRALDCATMSRNNREKEARKDAAQKAAEKPVARQAALPRAPHTLFGKKEETRRGYVELVQRFAPSLDAASAASLLDGVETAYLAAWDMADGVGGWDRWIRRLLGSLELIRTLEIAAMREKRVALERRVEALELKAADFGYRGIWREGNLAREGNFFTYGGSTWYCREATTDKPGESKAWQLAVKRGASSRDVNPHEIAKHLLPEVLKALEARGE